MKIDSLVQEDISLKENCNLCQESNLGTGRKTEYGAVIIYRVGHSNKDGWFATLSPKTGGDLEKDFTIQLMPFAHLTHFSQISNYTELAKNYGTSFAKLNNAMLKVIADETNFSSTAKSREDAVSVASYGKSTNWIEKKEHLHVKLFPFKGAIGQPYTVDSTFERKEVCEDEFGEKFVKMQPVKKKFIPEKRFLELSEKLIEILK